MAEFAEKRSEVLEITQDYLEGLIKLWKECFGHEMCNENLTKLTTHAKMFYDELMEQSEEKRAFMQKEIQDLGKEANNLQRILNIDFELPQFPSDTPLIFIQAQMDKSLEELRECFRQRREQICELLLEQEQLCEQLGQTPRPLLTDPLPTADELQDFREYLLEMDKERLHRMKQLSTMRRAIKADLEILELQVNTDKEQRLLNEREIKLDKETFVALETMQEGYAEQVRELNGYIDDMRNKLQTLWERLETTPKTREKYSRYTECNQTTYNKLSEELQRCEALKHKNLKLFVQQIRQEIRQWWEKTLTSEVQRQRFTHFQSQCYTDDLLLLHEMELDELKQHYEKNERIFQLFDDRKILWDRMAALEAKANDPGRFNNRGGQLLKEEKERKAVASKLPKIEQKIKELVAEYEESQQKSFLVYGENILNYMSNQWESKRQEKENQYSARKKAQKTPQRAATTRTPISLRNISSASAASLRRTPSSNFQLSVKRNAVTVAAQKRKLDASENLRQPAAKRSLMQALNSPSTFRRPGATVLSTKKAATATSQKPAPKQGVLGSSIARRRSGRRSITSTAAAKRRSGNKIFKKPAVPTPKIRVIRCSADEFTDAVTSDDTYESFERSIEPALRSTLSNTTIGNSGKKRLKRAQKFGHIEENFTAEELERLARLPDPRAWSKQNLHQS